MMISRLCRAALLASLSAPVLAASPTVEDLVGALSQHHPEYYATLMRIQQVAGERDEADAQFDLRVVQETKLRPSGYYDGNYAEQSIIQPLGPLNAEVFGTYRISDGNFPVYEADNETLDLGEASLGIKMALLQDRDTDSRRLALTTAAFRYMEAESKQQVELNKLIYRGVSSWLDWYKSYRKLEVVHELVELTRSRLRAIETRVENGDIAAISLTEFQTTLLQREVLEREAEQQFALAQQRLAYFWRPEQDARYRKDSIDKPPADIGWPYRTPTVESADFTEAIAAHPGLEVLQAKIEQTRNKQRLAQNETLPQLDLEVKLAQDIGDGMDYLSSTESVVGVSFFMPLGQRAARAREAIASAQIRELEYEARVLAEQIERDVDVSLNALDYSRQLLTLTRQQEQLATDLMIQEQARFNAGVSDQFLLISRETVALQARLKTVDAEIETLRNELALHATLAQLLPPRQ